jgi:hypothetical protein
LGVLVIRLVVAAGIISAVSLGAEARPVWRAVPTPMPEVIHTTKVRPPYIGPVWRYAPAPPEVHPVAADEPVPATEIVSVTPPPSTEKHVETSVLVAQANPPVPETAATSAKVVDSAPVAATETPVREPLPIVVAEKAPDTVPPVEVKPAAPTPATAAPAAEATIPAPGGKSWLDYLGVFVLAAIIGGTILMVARERKRTA